MANFVAWLSQQHGRTDTVGELAKSLRSDPRRTQMTTALDVSKRLNQDEASWEYHDALEQAESEWKASQ